MKLIPRERPWPKVSYNCRYISLLAPKQTLPPHWHNQVRRFLNETSSQRWIRRTGPKDLALHSWPPRSPDMIQRDFFLWEYVIERVYVPPLPADLMSSQTESRLQ